MKKTILNVVRYSNTDVVATSCISRPNMSEYSFRLDKAPCGWWLCGTNPLVENEDDGDSFIYYNENGTQTEVGDTNISEFTKNNDKWFHYDGNGGFEICTNSAHHHATMN